MPEAAAHAPALTDLDLPDGVADLLAVMGAEALLAFCDRWGGRRKYIPAVIDETHEIAQVCGLAAARALSRHVPGDTIQVPLLSGFHRALRDAAVRSEYPSTSAAELARRWRTTERTIYRIVSNDDDDAQMDMFS